MDYYNNYNNYDRDDQVNTQNIASQIVDSKLKERYGTSIDAFMAADYNKKLQDKVRILENEFKQIDYNGDSFLSIDEVTNFFQEHYNVRLNINFI